MLVFIFLHFLGLQTLLSLSLALSFSLLGFWSAFSADFRVVNKTKPYPLAFLVVLYTKRANPLDLPMAELNPIGPISISPKLVSNLPADRVLLLFLAEAEPEKLELELEVSAPLATEPRVLKGETGEARLSLRKSGLFSSQLSESWN